MSMEVFMVVKMGSMTNEALHNEVSGYVKTSSLSVGVESSLFILFLLGLTGLCWKMRLLLVWPL